MDISSDKILLPTGKFVDDCAENRKSIGYRLLVCSIVFYSTIQMLFLILFWTENITLKMFTVEIAVFNLTLPTIFIVVMILLYLKFSGRPYRNAIYRDKVRKILRMVFIWIISRYVRGIVGIFDELTILRIKQIFEDEGIEVGEIMGTSILIILFFMAIEIVPYFLTLDWSFMGLFMI